MIKRKSNPGEVLIVVSKLKGYIAGKGMRTGGKELIDQAIVRTKAHKQQTVTSKDL